MINNKPKKAKLLLYHLPFIFLQILLASLINHPPTPEQLTLILPVLKLGIGIPAIVLWCLRLLSYLLLLLSLLYLYQTSRKYFDAKISLFASLLIHASPAFFSLWFLHPFVSFAICLTSWLVKNYYYRKNTQPIQRQIFYLGSIFLLLFIINTNFHIQKSPFLDKIKLSRSQEEVIKRFMKEDTLKERIKFPIFFRRISYNKYYFTYKDLIKEIIGFFDLESIFFQEIHPLSQKSFVLFFWPEFLLFLLGLYWLIAHGSTSQKKYITLLTIIAGINFATRSGPPYLRLSLLLFPLGLIVASSIKFMESGAKKIKKATVGLIILYSIITNYYSLLQNYHFWFDNREIAYDFIYKSLQEINLQNYNKIYITSLIGDPRSYCLYYLKDCPEEKFSFHSFDLTSKNSQTKELYAGFIGEFLGKRIDNIFPPAATEEVRGKSLRILYQKKLRDSVAFQYGHQLIIAEKQ